MNDVTGRLDTHKSHDYHMIPIIDCFSINRIIDNVRGEINKWQWIIFDRDVDPEWVENLNSVLDDNKLLALPNGERLSIPPNVCQDIISILLQFSTWYFGKNEKERILHFYIFPDIHVYMFLCCVKSLS